MEIPVTDCKAFPTIIDKDVKYIIEYIQYIIELYNNSEILLLSQARGGDVAFLFFFFFETKILISV